MQIKHSEERGSGLMGEGLYFADRFDKALGYAHNSAYNDPSCKKASKLVLVCEVALGKIRYENSFKEIKNLQAGYSSIKLRGRKELSQTVVLEDGLKVPQGILSTVNYPDQFRHYIHSEYSEYVVKRPQ